MPRLDESFDRSQFRGVFDWDADFTHELAANDPWMYTAMHEKKLRKAIDCGKLKPRSKFDVSIAGEKHEVRCSWLDLNDWHNRFRDNFFGPFIIQIKLKELEGRRFYVFQRDERYSFVQWNEKTPMFREQKKRIDARKFFKIQRDGTLVLNHLARYKILLTRSVSLANAKVAATGHHLCQSISDRCRSKLDWRDSVAKLEEILGHKLMRERMFPKPFPLRRVIPLEHLPQELQLT